MQQNTKNSLDAFVVIKNTQPNRRPMQQQTPGDSCLGDQCTEGTGEGVMAIEAVPTRLVFPLCNATACLDASVDTKFVQPGRQNMGEGVATRQLPLRGSCPERAPYFINEAETTEIVGEVAHALGESSLSAAAINSIDAPVNSNAPQADSLAYSATDFRPYTVRR